MQEPIIKKKRLSYLWILPLLALGIGLYLAYDRYNALGPAIEIELDSAQGLEAGRTKIRYRSLDIGTVTDIALTDDFKKVVVRAQMTANAAPLLREDSQFWVVRPQVTVAGISGLDTLLSGSFISVAPGSSTHGARRFVGLDTPPLISADELGIRVSLKTDSAKGISIGSPVYYRGMKVGQIEQILFGEHYDNIRINAFINAPYDRLISPQTKFWNVSGFHLNFGAGGAEVAVESMETLLLGGITFSAPGNGDDESAPLPPDTLFTLYDNEQQTQKLPDYDPQQYVLFFDGSIRGLHPGAAVEFNGINIGRVAAINLHYDGQNNDLRVPVFIELESGRIAGDGDRPTVESLIKNGLQANLETGNFFSGSKIIRLNLNPKEKPASVEIDRRSQAPVIPTRAAGIDQITGDVGDIVARIRALPLEDLYASAANSLSGIEQGIAALEPAALGKNLNNSLKQLEGTLGGIARTSQSADTLLRNLNPQLQSIGKQLETTLYGIGPDSNLYYNLNETLQNLLKTSRTVDRFMHQLEAKPNSLIFGD